MRSIHWCCSCGPYLLLLNTTLLLLACRPGTQVAPVQVDRPQILQRVPHDTNAFTQGLLLDGDVWLESTGQYGRSDLREVERATGKLLRRRALPRNLFGEGLALHQGKLYQLTWHAGLCLVYDRETFQVVDHFRYEGEGWGLTNCEQWLYMSDGSARIQVRDPKTFAVTRSFKVHSSEGPITGINELQWIQGEIWANIFSSKTIVRFHPHSGAVAGFLDLQHLPLPDDQHPGQDVLNGIAYDPVEQSVWITGKNWSQLYQLAWPPPASAQ